LYALGLILFELFYPPAQEKLYEFFDDIKHHRKLPESVKNRSIISDLILKLTSKDPKIRPSFKDIFEMLDYSPVASRTLNSRTRCSEIQEIENRMSPNVVYKHVVCGLCEEKDICGIRYKCSVCPDFDLCETCESKPGSHTPNHPLMKIKEASLFQVNNSQVKRTLLRDRLNLHRDNYNDEDDDGKLLAMLNKLNSKIQLEDNYSKLENDNGI
jgi:serine/threonine protein kinase